MRYKVQMIGGKMFLVRRDENGQFVDTFETPEQAQHMAVEAGESFVVSESEAPYRQVRFGLKTWSGFVMMDGVKEGDAGQKQVGA